MQSTIRIKPPSPLSIITAIARRPHRIESTHSHAQITRVAADACTHGAIAATAHRKPSASRCRSTIARQHDPSTIAADNRSIDSIKRFDRSTHVASASIASACSTIVDSKHHRRQSQHASTSSASPPRQQHPCVSIQAIHRRQTAPCVEQQAPSRRQQHHPSLPPSLHCHLIPRRRRRHSATASPSLAAKTRVSTGQKR